jgi:hypothetical protein
VSGWETVLFDRYVRPTPVAIMEALERIGQPVSPVQMASVIAGDGPPDVNHVAYYFRALAKLGLIVCVATGPVRGSTEHFYLSTYTVMVGRPLVPTQLAPR